MLKQSFCRSEVVWLIHCKKKNNKQKQLFKSCTVKLNSIILLFFIHKIADGLVAVTFVQFTVLFTTRLSLKLIFIVCIEAILILKLVGIHSNVLLHVKFFIYSFIQMIKKLTKTQLKVYSTLWFIHVLRWPKLNTKNIFVLHFGSLKFNH